MQNFIKTRKTMSFAPTMVTGSLRPALPSDSNDLPLALYEKESLSQPEGIILAVPPFISDG